jgi:acetoin utilization deacetylase AcuC-like enzyme
LTPSPLAEAACGCPAPDYVLISAGFDTFGGDPLSKFQLTTSGFERIGRRIASLKRPTLVAQEGGYAVEQLGLNVVSFLRGLLDGM